MCAKINALPGYRYLTVSVLRMSVDITHLHARLHFPTFYFIRLTIPTRPFIKFPLDPFGKVELPVTC